MKQDVAIVGELVLSAVLRESTGEAHKRAEQHPHQIALMRGPMNMVGYRRLVVEMRRVYEAIQPGVDALRKSVRFAAWGKHFADREAVFAADFAAVGGVDERSAETRAVAALREAVSEYVAQGRWFAVVGMLYVLEGSTNGGMFISKAVEKRLGLERGAGTGWLNPYGDGARERWGQARLVLDDLKASSAEATEAVLGANAMFKAIEDISEELQGAVVG